ncbi:hypothetical protein [Streptomyces sp. MMBL 11-3]|uniref:hypothetical protein n=1 Tax=Streptomyces sp. MMBL 11-3 TaxID=3382639 RepID=UPI0039B53670
MPLHALDITLTRPLTPAETRQTSRTMPFAANHDATRLLTLVHAKTADKALTRLRNQIDGRLPVDVITTHYPDADGQVLLNIAFPPATRTAFKDAAREAGQPSRVFLQQLIHRALTRHSRQEADRLDQEVQHLLARTTAAHLLAALGRALTHTPGTTPC